MCFVGCSVISFACQTTTGLRLPREIQVQAAPGSFYKHDLRFSHAKTSLRALLNGAGIALTGTAALICISRHWHGRLNDGRPASGVFVQVGGANCVKVTGASVASRGMRVGRGDDSRARPVPRVAPSRHAQLQAVMDRPDRSEFGRERCRQSSESAPVCSWYLLRNDPHW